MVDNISVESSEAVISELIKLHISLFNERQKSWFFRKAQKTALNRLKTAEKIAGSELAIEAEIRYEVNFWKEVSREENISSDELRDRLDDWANLDKNNEKRQKIVEEVKKRLAGIYYP